MANQTNGGSWSRRPRLHSLGAKRTEAARIHARYRDVIVDVQTPSLATHAVEVAGFATLIKLATATGSHIQRLPDAWTGADVFYVDGGDVRYRYRAAGHPNRRRLVTV